MTYELPAARRKSRLERLAKVDALFKAGASVPEMVEATGATRPTIYTDLKDLGHRTPDGWTAEARERQGTKTAIVHARNKRQRRDPARCSVKGCKTPAVDRFKGAWYWAECLLTAGDYNPYYEEEQRQAALEGHTESALARAPEMMGSKRSGNPVDLSKALDRAMEREGIPRRKMMPDWVVPKDLATLGPYKTGGER